MWMCLFHWFGRDAQSQPISGQSYAHSALALRQRYARQHIYLYNIRYAGLRYLPKWRHEHLAYFCQQLAILLETGFSLYAALKLLHQHTEHPWLRLALPDLTQIIESGDSLTKACQSYPMLFDQFFLAFIDTGEQSGQLQTCLTQLQAHYHRLSKTEKQTSQAMFYPLLIICFGFAVITALMHWALPQTAALFSQANAPLPALTQLLLDTYRGLQQAFMPIIIALCTLLGSIYYLQQTHGLLRQCKQRFYAALPGLGLLQRYWQSMHFLDVLSLCYASGIRIDKAVELAIQASRSVGLQQNKEAILLSLREGHPLTEILQPMNLLPTLVIELLRTGEQSGSFEKMSTTGARWLEQQASERLARLLKVLEPSLLIIFGLLLGVLILALYLPLFQMAELMG